MQMNEKWRIDVHFLGQEAELENEERIVEIIEFSCPDGYI
jgi:hypothetical protein